MASRTCMECGHVGSEETDFYPHSGGGYNNRCKECYKGKVSAYQRTPKGRAVMLAASRRRYYRDPLKIWARRMLNRAVNSGQLSRPDECSQCGETGTIHGHHEDYTKPFEVEWLCSRCH